MPAGLCSQPRTPASANRSRLNIPKACPEGTEFSRKRQRCVPIFNQQEPEFEPQDDDGEPQLRLPKIDLNNNLLNLQNSRSVPQGHGAGQEGPVRAVAVKHDDAVHHYGCDHRFGAAQGA